MVASALKQITNRNKTMDNTKIMKRAQEVVRERLMDRLADREVARPDLQEIDKEAYWKNN